MKLEESEVKPVKGYNSEEYLRITKKQKHKIHSLKIMLPFPLELGLSRLPPGSSSQPVKRIYFNKL